MFQFADLCAQFAFLSFLFIEVKNQDHFKEIILAIEDLFKFFPYHPYKFIAPYRLCLNKFLYFLFVVKSACLVLTLNQDIYLSKIQAASPFLKSFSSNLYLKEASHYFILFDHRFKQYFFVSFKILISHFDL